MPPRRERTRADRPRRRRGLGIAIGLVSVLLVLGVGATAVFFAFEGPIRSLMTAEEPIDYEGTGTGEVIVTITDGQVGSDVATTLADADVTRTYEAFYSLLLENPDVAFLPGSYALRTQMSAQAALDALLDPANKVFTRVTIPEGTSLTGVLTRLGEVSAATGVTREQLDAASQDLAAFGLPAGTPSLEGYLFPATYSFEPGIDAITMLKTLSNEMTGRLDALGVAAEDRNRVLTVASLIQREAGSNPDDFYKVSRVIQNRLDSGMPLQFDSTAQYGFTQKYGQRDDESVFTNEQELSDDNPYNTYVISGLPIGPIGAPGEVAIDAALKPAEGTWEYFVTVNLDTGETVFSTTLDEQNAAVSRLQQWCRDTQSPNCA